MTVRKENAQSATERSKQKVEHYKAAIAALKEEHGTATMPLLRQKLGVTESQVYRFFRHHPELRSLMTSGPDQKKAARNIPEERRDIMFVPNEPETITCSVWHPGAGRPCLETVSQSQYQLLVSQNRVEKTFSPL